MKYYLYYITRANFEGSFNYNLPILLSYNPPVYTSLNFINDIALYAYTDDKFIAREFEKSRNMNLFIKIKTKRIDICNSISYRKINIQNLYMMKVDVIDTISIPIVDDEYNFLNMEILQNISQELMCVEYGIQEEVLSVNTKYKKALSMLGFQKPNYYDDSLNINHRLNQFNLFIKIYKNFLNKEGDDN